MRVLLDASVAFGEQFFRHFGEIRIKSPTEITAADARWSDILICRSKLRVDENLLGLHKPFFVGTATAGVDHLDQQFLRSRGIAYASTPGCNACSVVDYVISCMFLWAGVRQRQLSTLSVGIVGCGHVGGELLTRLQKLGIKTKVSDPPLEASGKERLPFASLEAVLDSDVISLHTPLITAGSWPTRGLIDEAMFGFIPEGSLLLSCGRGEVVESEALTHWAAGSANSAVVDVWEDEPLVDQDLLNAAWIATPHIAGYSLDGRVGGTRMLRHALVKLLHDSEQPVPGDMPSIVELTSPPAVRLSINSVEEAKDIVMAAYDPRIDDQNFRTSQLTTEPAAGFQHLRAHYRLRRDFARQPVIPATSQTAEILQALGFRLAG